LILEIGNAATETSLFVASIPDRRVKMDEKIKIEKSEKLSEFLEIGEIGNVNPRDRKRRK
jgi:hypothetical protein